MKIIFEEGDLVNVEDDFEAGDFAACEVRLIKKVSETEWLVENESVAWGPKGKGVVNECWLYI